MSDAPERPYLLAFASALVAAVVGAVVYSWADAQPERVLVGRAGRHDGAAGTGRHATCLDCHVPFVGTPASRCLGPGCHGELATGSPPKTGPAMPVRFHVAVRDEPCELCHGEHDAHASATPRVFEHDLIPEARRECRRCHVASTVESHSRTDAVGCAECHGLESWKGRPIEHARVADVHCDSCHQAPKTAAHGELAGTCSACHDTGTWAPRAPTGP